MVNNCSNAQSNAHTSLTIGKIPLTELSVEKNFTENREYFLNDDVDETVDYIFGDYPFCEEPDDSSEVDESSEVEDNSDMEF